MLSTANRKDAKSAGYAITKVVFSVDGGTHTTTALVTDEEWRALSVADLYTEGFEGTLLKLPAGTEILSIVREFVE